MAALTATRTVLVIALAIGLAGCASGKPAVMPDLVGKTLDVAKSDIKRAGYGDKVDVVGGGTFGVVKESNWTVCEQLPAPGEQIEAPRVTVDRSCGDDAEASGEPSASPSSTPSPTPESGASGPATPITVDELLDKLNSAGMGGVKEGDRFAVTGELFMSKLWGVRPGTGDYAVMFKAKAGAQDLEVFAPQSDASGWHDGTRLEAVLKIVKRTLSGETTDGWLEIESAKVIG